MDKRTALRRRVGISGIAVKLTEHLLQGFSISSMGGMWIFSGIAHYVVSALLSDPTIFFRVKFVMSQSPEMIQESV